jgi:hypothetical protein
MSTPSIVGDETDAFVACRICNDRAQFGGDLGLLSLDNPIPLSQEHLLDPNNPDANPEAAGVIHEMTEVERQTDLTFRRLCITIEQMVLDARQALDQSMKPAGVKVLSSFDMGKLLRARFAGP